MKKLVLASAMAAASVALVALPALRAQDSSGQITISNPAEFNAYQNAVTQTQPAAKAQALEAFLKDYPKSVVKKAVLQDLIGTYQQLNDPAKALDAASQLLEVDPQNMQAIFISVYLKKNECQQSINPNTGVSKNPQVCDQAASLAQKGLGIAKPSGLEDASWKKMTNAAYPIFHSAIALDDMVSKKDYADAIKQYTAELMLYGPQQTESGPGLVDTLQLAEAYTMQGPTRDEVKACWFYARAWNFAPAAYKSQIEPKLEYWYKRYHGNLTGLNDVKQQAAQTVFPPSSFTIKPAPTPVEIVHNVIATTPDLTKLNLEDKEFILANGSPADAQKLWSVLQGQMTPVPGIVISDPATVLKVTVTTVGKPKDYTVKLNTPAACSAVPPPPTSDLHVTEARKYLEANGASSDVSAITGLAHAHKIAIEPAVTAIDVAVTQDAKDSKTADFLVNMKEPVSCKDAPAPDSVVGTLPTAVEVDGTYSTYTTTAAKPGVAAKAKIVLTGGFVQHPQKAKPTAHHPVHRGARRAR